MCVKLKADQAVEYGFFFFFFCCSHFSDRVLNTFCLGLASYWDPPNFAFHIVGIVRMNHTLCLFLFEIRVFLTFYLGWSLTTSLSPISDSQVVGTEPVYPVFLFFVTGSHCVAQTGLELRSPDWPLTCNTPGLSSARITGMYGHTWFKHGIFFSASLFLTNPQPSEHCVT
jgi:hypothetical protein